MSWFPQEDRLQGDVQTTMATRFLEANPIRPYTFRPYCTEGIVRNSSYRYVADMGRILPNTPLSGFTYLWGQYRCDADQTQKAVLIPFGPVQVYLNGQLCAESDVVSEKEGRKVDFSFHFRKGVNDVIVALERTVGGFGCEFGTWLGKLDYYFLKPGTDEEGFLYSVPSERMTESVTADPKSIRWVSDRTLYPEEEVLSDLFPYAKQGTYAVGLVSVTATRPTSVGEGASGISALTVDGERRDLPCTLEPGTHRLMAVSSPRSAAKWGLSLHCDQKMENAILTESSPYAWSYAGPFASLDDALTLPDPHNVFPTTEGLGFWRLGFPGGWVRMYNDNRLFGHWNYPLGVTLYGLMQTAESLGECPLSSRIKRYLQAHLNASIDTYDYALFDARQFGGASNVHHLMTSLDSLDDCGSFCATLLEVAAKLELHDFGRIVETVHTHIAKRQARLSDGTFYRKHLMHAFHNQTLWADDLYMSVPFLVRYARYADAASSIDDAANQFRGFVRRLEIPGTGLLSHVYDFNGKYATGIPWGRGNGWALFSLSELLLAMDADHPDREEMVKLFRRLSKAYLAVQDPAGMWHQVLDYPESYPETSCTAMFVSAFARGCTHRWFDDPEPYRKSALRGWEAIRTTAIDKDGCLYGVCRGSEFSCSRHYYAERLLPQLDDTHGIGIVLIAADAVGTLERG